jgi:hypothetical protein
MHGAQVITNSSGTAVNNTLDSVAVGVSMTCLVHCLALPLLIALVPAWSSWVAVPESFHFWMVVFALPFSLAVLWHSARKRYWFSALWIGSAGLALMALALWVPNPFAEALVTSTGAILLALAHVRNWRRRSYHSGRRG